MEMVEVRTISVCWESIWDKDFSAAEGLSASHWDWWSRELLLLEGNVDHNVHLAAVAKFNVRLGTEPDKVSTEGNVSPSFKGEVVGVTIKIGENNLVFSTDRDAFEGIL